MRQWPLLGQILVGVVACGSSADPTVAGPKPASTTGPAASSPDGAAAACHTIVEGCCGAGLCDLSKNECCITSQPPQTLTCRAKGEPCAGDVRHCNSPADCGGRACCEQGVSATTCSSGAVCPGNQRALCLTAADCPPGAPNCCGVDLTFRPYGAITFNECRTVCAGH